MTKVVTGKRKMLAYNWERPIAMNKFVMGNMMWKNKNYKKPEMWKWKTISDNIDTVASKKT